MSSGTEMERAGKTTNQWLRQLGVSRAVMLRRMHFYLHDDDLHRGLTGEPLHLRQVDDKYVTIYTGIPQAGKGGCGWYECECKTCGYVGKLTFNDIAVRSTRRCCAGDAIANSQPIGYSAGRMRARGACGGAIIDPGVVEVCEYWLTRCLLKEFKCDCLGYSPSKEARHAG